MEEIWTWLLRSGIPCEKKEIHDKSDPHFFSVTLTKEKPSHIWGVDLDRLKTSIENTTTTTIAASAEDDIKKTPTHPDSCFSSDRMIVRQILLGSTKVPTDPDYDEMNVVEVETVTLNNHLRTPIAMLSLGEASRVAQVNLEFPKAPVIFHLSAGTGPIHIQALICARYSPTDGYYGGASWHYPMGYDRHPYYLKRQGANLIARPVKRCKRNKKKKRTAKRKADDDEEEDDEEEDDEEEEEEEEDEKMEVDDDSDLESESDSDDEEKQKTKKTKNKRAVLKRKLHDDENQLQTDDNKESEQNGGGDGADAAKKTKRIVPNSDQADQEDADKILEDPVKEGKNKEPAELEKEKGDADAAAGDAGKKEPAELEKGVKDEYASTASTASSTAAAADDEEPTATKTN